MTTTLQQFFGSLAHTGGLYSGRFEGASATTDATVAMATIIRQYVDLSTYGEKLRQLLAAGVKVPCDVWAAYAAARQDYLVKGQSVFTQLAQKGITVEQVVYSGGKPKLDPTDPSKTMTVQVQAPLRPPAFTGLSCPGVPMMSGGGWQPVPIGNVYMLGSIDTSTIASIAGALTGSVVILLSGGTALGLASATTAKTYKGVAVLLDAFDTSPTRILSAYTACVETYVRNGLAVTDAGNRCASAQTSAQQYGIEKAKINAEAAKGGLGFFGWLGVGTAVVIVGAILLRYVKGRAGAAVRAISPVGEGGVLLGDLYFRPRGRYRGRR